MGVYWSPEGAQKTIAAANRAGFGLIEIPAVSRESHDWSLTSRLLEEYGLNASVSLALDFDSDISSTNQEISAKGEHRLNEAIDFATAIKAKFVGGVTYSAMGRYLKAPTPEARANSIAVLSRIANRAKDFGIDLGIEYVNRYESNLLNSVSETLKFIADLGAENVVLHLDTFHAQIEEANLNDALTLAGSRLGYIHASESHRGIIGTGSIDWTAFILTLKSIDYRGPITLETFSSAVITEQQSIEIGLWQPKWTDPNKVASDAFKYLNSLMTNTID